MTNIKNSIDWQALLKITENPDIAKELLTMFAVELPKFRTEINTAYEQKDYATLKDRAHKLHGCCCYAGVLQLKKIAAELELILQTKNTLVINELIQQLNTEADLVLTAIEQNTFADE